MTKGKVIILDHGAGDIKAGFAGENDPRCIVPNCTANLERQYRTLYADETVSLVKNKSQLKYTRPFERGYCTDWPVECEIWDHLFGKSLLNIDPTKTRGLVTTEPFFNPRVVQERMDQLVFEQQGFPAYFVGKAPQFSAHHIANSFLDENGKKQSCFLIVESGYSFTHVVPIFDMRPIVPAVRRVDIGGKLMTNYLKELVSYRAYHMQDETYLMTQVKEKLCFVSLDPETDFSRKPSHVEQRRRARSLRREFVLPNYRTTVEGFVRPLSDPSSYLPHEIDALNETGGEREDLQCKVDSSSQKGGGKGKEKKSLTETAGDTPRKKNALSAGYGNEQLLILDLERVSVPELLFHPRDVGMLQGGIAVATTASAQLCHPHMQPLLYQNIYLTGGNALLPNIRKRLQLELRKLVPTKFKICISTPNQANLTAWRGASTWASGKRLMEDELDNFDRQAVTKQEYEEYGHNICRWKFAQI
eukprot:g5554.t1